MFTIKSDGHIHSYTSLGFIREVGIDRVILTRNCVCGYSQAFECGNKESMRKLYVQLAKKKPSAVS